MYGFLLALLVLDGIVLTVAVLLQAGKGGGLAAMGGGMPGATEGVLGGRQAATFLTRTTWTTGAIFMVLALVLSIRSSQQQQPGSVLQDALQVPVTPTPVVPQAQPSTEIPAAPGGGPDATPPSQP